MIFEYFCRTTDETDTSLDEIDDNEDEFEENFAQPEFKALWEANGNPIASSDRLSSNWKSGGHKYSKYEEVFIFHIIIIYN